MRYKFRELHDDETLRISLANKILEYKKANRLTWKEMGIMADVTEKTIHNLSNIKGYFPRFKTIRGLLRLMDVSYDELLSEDFLHDVEDDK